MCGEGNGVCAAVCIVLQDMLSGAMHGIAPVNTALCCVDCLILAKGGLISLVCSVRKPTHFIAFNLDKFRPF